MAKVALEETYKVGLTGNPVRGRQHSYPASILHVHRHVQSQHMLKSFTVYFTTDEFILTQHYVYYIAGDEAHREKHQDGQYKQGGDHQH